MTAMSKDLFNAYAQRAALRDEDFVVKTQWQVMRAAPGDLYNGIFRSPRDFNFLVTRDKDDAFHLWAAKDPSCLKTTRDKSGNAHLAEESMKSSYHVAAFRMMPDESNKKAIFHNIQKAMKKFDKELGEREGHYRVRAISMPAQEVGVTSAHYGEAASVWFNAKGYNAYVLDNQTNEATQYLSVYREADEKGNHHFRPVLQVKNGWWGYGTPEARYEIRHDGTREGALKSIDENRRKVMGAAWEQESLYRQNGFNFGVKCFAFSAANAFHRRVKVTMPAMVGVTGIYFSVNESLALWLALGGTAAHIASAEVSEMAWDKARDVTSAVKRGFLPQKITDLPYAGKNTGNIGKYYLQGYDNPIRNHNIRKFAPKADLKKCRSEEQLMLDDRDVLELNRYVHARSVGDLHEDSLGMFLLRMHQLNLPMVEYDLLDSSEYCPRAFECDNGISGVIFPEKNGKIEMFAQYNPQLIKNQRLKPPKHYIDKLESGGVHIVGTRSEVDMDIDICEQSGQMCYNALVNDLCARIEALDGVEQEKERACQIIAELIRPSFNPCEDSNHFDVDFHGAFTNTRVKSLPLMRDDAPDIG